MLNIKELKNNLYVGDFGDQVTNYSDGTLYDILLEISENNIDIYTNDLFDWAKSNIGEIEEANEELGTPTDILQQIQQGQANSYLKALMEDYKEIIKYYALDYIEKYLELQEINEEKWDDLAWELESFSDYDITLEEIEEKTKEFLEL